MKLQISKPNMLLSRIFGLRKQLCMKGKFELKSEKWIEASYKTAWEKCFAIEKICCIVGIDVAETLSYQDEAGTENK